MNVENLTSLRREIYVMQLKCIRNSETDSIVYLVTQLNKMDLENTFFQLIDKHA